MTRLMRMTRLMTILHTHIHIHTQPTPRGNGGSPRRGGFSARDQLRDPESARRQVAGVLRRAPSCADPKINGWGSAAEGITNGQVDAQPLYACPNDKPSRIRGRTERDLIHADPNAVVDALHGVLRPRVRGTGKDVRDIVNPNQLMPWSKSAAQRFFLQGASAQELAVFRKISERVFANLRHEQDCAQIMRHLDPRGRCSLHLA